MNLHIILKPACTLVGLACQADQLPEQYEPLWQQLARRHAEIPHADPDRGYGLHICRNHTHNYLAGLAVRRLSALPAGMQAERLPGYAYAVFSHHGAVTGLPATLTEIFTAWLPSSGYCWAADFYYEFYDDRFQPGSADSLLSVYVPVRTIS